MAIAMGSFTITDLNDATALTGFIGSNLQKSQVYNPDTGAYTPNWATQNLVLTPELYVAGTTTNVIANTEVQSVKWYEGTSATAITTAGSYALSGTKSHILTIKSNIMAASTGVDFTCVITYKDSNTGLIYTHKMAISFVKVSSGGGIADAIASTPNGNVFKNASISSLTAECDLWRGSTVDVTSVTYQWYVQDSSQATDVGGGVGWKKCTGTGNATRCLTVKADDVVGIAVFKCIIKDTDTASNSYNQTFTDTVTFVDLSDPIQITVESTGGDVFKNGSGSSTLTARLFQAGVELDTAGTKYTYKWYKFDKSGSLVTGFGGTGVNYKTGKTLSVGTSDVDVKATFKIELE